VTRRVSGAEVNQTLTEYGRQHPRADVTQIRGLLVKVYGADFAGLQLLKAAHQSEGHVLIALGDAWITIHPTFAVFDLGAPDYARPDRGLYNNRPIVRWESGRYGTGQRSGGATASTLCPNCYIEFPGSQCDLCGHEADPPGEVRLATHRDEMLSVARAGAAFGCYVQPHRVNHASIDVLTSCGLTVRSAGGSDSTAGSPFGSVGLTGQLCS
jgi:hypothetical protein